MRIALLPPKTLPFYQKGILIHKVSML
uniref:Uncharacterized protein n=1 Tax=Rhizophora mucronata TaxID=61149 RepID=A0A2P2PHT4_RHIMU